jgi:hypothetical protein
VLVVVGRSDLTCARNRIRTRTPMQRDHPQPKLLILGGLKRGLSAVLGAPRTVDLLGYRPVVGVLANDGSALH